MEEIQFKTTKTARLFVNGSIKNETKEIVIVFHGYAQLAKYFIKNFDSIRNNERAIIAPEGLSKFYWNGMNGRVVASWMTKEDRENEIEDQKNYLDQVFSLIKSHNQKAKITVLGFSQGTATLCRWLAASEPKIDRIILWAGGIPEDVLKSNYIKNKKMEIVIGDKDEYISSNKIKTIENRLIENQFSFNIIKFPGNHSIKKEKINDLFSL